MIMNPQGDVSNFGGALWDEGILVRALPSLVSPETKITVFYHFLYNITIIPSIPLIGDYNLVTTAQDSTMIQVISTSAPMRAAYNNEQATVEIRHINPGDTRLRFIAVAADPANSNYHNAEIIIDVTLNYPGFELDNRECVWGGVQGCSTVTLHVQRWKDKALTGTDATPGTARVYLTPNEAPDATTTINIDNSEVTKVLIQSQDRVNSATDNGLDKLLRWSTASTLSKFFQATHLNIIGEARMSFSTPTSASKWPALYACPAICDANCRATCCHDADFACPASNNKQAVYFGIVMPIPSVRVIMHAGFKASQTLVRVQRQNYVVVKVSLDTIPTDDTFIYLTSSDPSIATVTSQVLFLRGEKIATSWRNVTIYNIQPGSAWISFKSSSPALDYDGAEADNAIRVQCQRGFQISSLLVYVQAKPTNGGLAVFSITPDLAPTHNVRMAISSSQPNQTTVVSANITFFANQVNETNVTLSHVSSGSLKAPVVLTLTLFTHVDSNYYFVVAPRVTVVPLGTFVLSSSFITVQKGRQTDITVAPNIAPDQDVTVRVRVSNETAVTATQSVIFLAGSLEPQVVTVTHHILGTASLSFSAVSVAGNYNGAELADAVDVFAVQGFEVFKRVPGIKQDVMGERVPEKQNAFIVQPQPSSHLAQARFLLLSDLPVDRDVSITILSSDQSIVSTMGASVTIVQGTRGPALVTVQHGGVAGEALISFRVDTVGGNYNGVESGNVKVVAMPLLIFSSAIVNIQTDGLGIFTVQPGTAPSEDVSIQCVSSDPAVATVTAAVILTAAGGTSTANTKTVTLVYKKQGQVTVSFFASGGNFDGLVWVDGIVAASRPGFVVSTAQLSVPYHGEVTFTIRPDTVPTESALVTVTSSQQAKAAATEATRTFYLVAGRQDTFSITIKSWCSSSPGNCARAGATIIGFEATALAGSSGASGNYEGVVSARTITAFVEPPRLVLTHGNSPRALLVQAELGATALTVRPSQPVDVDVVVSIRVVDTAVCSAISTLIIPRGSSVAGTVDSSQNGVGRVPVTFHSVGTTQIEFSVDSPGDSKFLKIDPEILPVRTLSGFAVSPSYISLQPGTSVMVTIRPMLLPQADVEYVLEVSDPSVMTVSPSTLTFSPPRLLIGRDVVVKVGLRVVLSEEFQVLPRIGDGTIMLTLNDNLDLVTVDWDAGPQNQTVSAGAGGVYMLAQAQNLSHTVRVSHLGIGNASISLRATSDDPVYNGAHVVHAVKVSAEPGLILIPASATIQYQQSSSFQVWPQTAPSSDVAVAVTIVATDPATGSLRPDLVAAVSPTSLLLLRSDGLSVRNRRSVTVTCLGPAGTVRVLFDGSSPSALPFSDEIRSSNYDRMQHAAVTVQCLPGFALAREGATPQALAQPSMLSLSALASPKGAVSLTLALLEVPTERVTVVITVSDLSLLLFTSRIYFEALEQQQTRLLTFSHRGGFQNGTAVVSLAAAGGNYQDTVLRNAIVIPVDAPALLVATKNIIVNANGYSTFSISLNTPPSSPTVVSAASSDELVATVDGPITISDTAPYTVRVTHVHPGTANISFTVSSVPGSTYGSVVVDPDLTVAVVATRHGFRVSSSHITLAQGTSSTLSIAPDTKLDSRVQLTATVVPAGIATVSPSSHFFEPASTFAATAHGFQLTWSGTGSAVLELRAKGGLYQGFASTSQVAITSLPPLPSAPSGLAATAMHGSILVISFLPPGSGDAVSGYRVQVSESADFALRSAQALVTSSPVDMGPLTRGRCYYYRVASINSAGYSADAVSSSCTRALDAPSAVSALTVAAMTEQEALVHWRPPADSGDGTSLGVAILSYVMEVVVNGSAVVAQRLEVQAPSSSLLLPIRPSNIYLLRLSAVTSVTVLGPSENWASVYFAYTGAPVDYYVPLEFAISASLLTEKVGRTSSFTITPGSAPYVDAVVRIKSNVPSSASALTSQVIFRKGLTTAQTVVIAHRQRGGTNLTFEVDGSNYRGLREWQVQVETLPSDDPAA